MQTLRSPDHKIVHSRSVKLRWRLGDVQLDDGPATRFAEVYVAHDRVRRQLWASLGPVDVGERAGCLVEMPRFGDTRLLLGIQPVARFSRSAIDLFTLSVLENLRRLVETDPRVQQVFAAPAEVGPNLTSSANGSTEVPA